MTHQNNREYDSRIIFPIRNGLYSHVGDIFGTLDHEKPTIKASGNLIKSIQESDPNLDLSLSDERELMKPLFWCDGDEGFRMPKEYEKWLAKHKHLPQIVIPKLRDFVNAVYLDLAIYESLPGLKEMMFQVLKGEPSWSTEDKTNVLEEIEDFFNNETHFPMVIHGLKTKNIEQFVKKGYEHHYVNHPGVLHWDDEKVFIKYTIGNAQHSGNFNFNNKPRSEVNRESLINSFNLIGEVRSGKTTNFAPPLNSGNYHSLYYLVEEIRSSHNLESPEESVKLVV